MDSSATLMVLESEGEQRSPEVTRGLRDLVSSLPVGALAFMKFTFSSPVSGKSHLDPAYRGP